MRTKMPDVINAYIQASNSRDADRFGSLFSEDAIVHDEEQEYRGHCLGYCYLVGEFGTGSHAEWLV